jgi:integrating conjugative element protein (TIGR03765 family)
MVWFLWLVLSIFMAPVLAEPVVIYDAGNTQPLAPYRDAVTVKRPPAVMRGSKPPPFGAPTGRFNKAMWLPIRTPEMTPAPLAHQTLEPTLRERLSQLTRPLFLVGSDPESLNWLVQHREQLQALGAVGMLVQADSAAELAAVEHAGADLVIVPASGSMLAKLLGLRHYPVLISREGIEQ